MNYKLLQLTNNSIGTQVANTYLPFGVVTGRINCPYRLDGSISIANSGSDVVVIGTNGHYKLYYGASLVVGGTGTLTLNLLINGSEVYSVAVTASGAGTVSPILEYEFKVCSTVPTNVQIQLSGLVVTGGVSNTIIEKVY